MALYDYALQLFTKRLNAVGVSIDPHHVDKVVKTVEPDPCSQKKNQKHVQVIDDHVCVCTCVHCASYF